MGCGGGATGVARVRTPRTCHSRGEIVAKTKASLGKSGDSECRGWCGAIRQSAERCDQSGLDRRGGGGHSPADTDGRPPAPLPRAWRATYGAAMKTFLIEFFTWWNGQTMGTRFHTWRHGEKVGTDTAGNIYYQTRGGQKDPALGIVRRWVVYNGEAEATSVPPGWMGWLRHTTDTAPSQADYTPREWERPHQPNMTGTAQAYRPKGSIMSPSGKAAAGTDYEAWTPGA